MDDLAVRVKQIAQYPLLDAIGPDDVLILQQFGLGGPLRSIKQDGLFQIPKRLAVGILPPPNALGLVASTVTTPLGARQGFNWYLDDGGFQRYLQNGVAGQWSFGDAELAFAIAPWGQKDQLVTHGLTWGQPGPFTTLFALSFDGKLILREQLSVGRDPALPDEVATLNWVQNNTVLSLNGRSGAVTLMAADLNSALNLQPGDGVAAQSWVNAAICQAIERLYWSNPFVYTFQGRVGDICLTADDITFALTQPGVYASANSPALGDASGRIATTLFVDEGLQDLYDRIQADINQIIDLSAYAKLASPAFTGVPTAPTANPGTTTGQLATTAFVQAAVAASTAGVSSFNTRTGAVVLSLADITGAGGAPLASPTFSGTPAGPTAAPGTNTTELATTAFVQAAVAAISAGVTSFNGRSGVVTLITSDITGAGGAPIASPALTGVPTAPTVATADSSTTLATTAFVHAAVAAVTGVTSFNARSGAVTLIGNDISAAGGAMVASPTFTGVPAAPTAAANTSTTQLATCAFVLNQIAASAAGVASFNGRTGVVTLTAGDVTGAGGAPIASPTFTGLPAAPTAATTDSSTTLATTAFVKNAIAATSLVSSFNGRSGAVSLIGADVSAAGGALLASPTFTGTPSGPTAAPGTNTTQLATCAFVLANIGVTSFNTRTGPITLTGADITGAGGALLASPSFTGTPLAPTPTAGTNNTQLATTAFVQAAIAGIATGVASFNTRTGAVVLTPADVTGASRAPIRQVITATGAGTYTTPAGALWLDVEMSGAGGGGQNGNGTAGAAGTATTFGTSFLTCPGGGTSGAAGAVPTGGDINIAGGADGNDGNTADSVTMASGSRGASSYWGGGGYSQPNAAGGNANAPGAGGGGGGTNAVTAGSNPGGIGGGSSGYLRKRITSPAASYAYTNGTGGNGATVGTTGFAGGRGGDGMIIVDAYFQ